MVLSFVFSVESFDWSIPGDTISVSGSTIVINIAELDLSKEYLYKCAARNAVGTSPFAEKSLKHLTDESCPVGSMATSGGLGLLWIIVIILVLV